MDTPLSIRTGGVLGTIVGAFFGGFLFGGIYFLMPPIDELSGKPLNWLILLLTMGVVGGSIVGALTGILTIYGQADRTQGGCVGCVVGFGGYMVLGGLGILLWSIPYGVVGILVGVLIAYVRAVSSNIPIKPTR